MKISEKMGSHVIHQKRQKAQTNDQFKQLVQSQTDQLKKHELKQLMDEISKQGDKLARFRSFRDLVRFKHLIKGFLEKTVYDGLKVCSSYSISLQGDGKQLNIIKQIDEKLIELTDHMMNQEKKSVNILEIVGEIKGLLVNIYM